MKTRFGLLMLFFWPPIAAGQTSAIIKLDFPAMPVQRIRPGLLLAAEEPFSGTITLDSGTVLTVTHGSIPATYVRGLGLRKTVEKCVATGTIDGGGSIVMQLPAEPVRLRLGSITALAIYADVVIVLANGKTMTGTVLFPDCPVRRVGRGGFVADALVATGTAKIR